MRYLSADFASELVGIYLHRYLFANAVDNVACKIADPLFLGFCICADVKAGNKVTEKRDPHEKVGLQCIRDGCYEVVEYVYEHCLLYTSDAADE